MIDPDYIPTPEERSAYTYGFVAVDYGNLKTDRYPINPYDDIEQQNLWEAWEIGFNDAFENAVEKKTSGAKK